MTAHLPPEVIVAYLDGTLDEATERQAAAHLRQCTGCAQQLAELRSFEEFVLPATAPGAETEAAMFDVAQRVLEQKPGERDARAGPRGRGWIGPLLLAALVLLAATLYATIGDGSSAAFSATLHREAPAGTLRGPVQRLHVELEVPSPQWLLVFARSTDDRLDRLFPPENAVLAALAAPMPLQPGHHRVPGDPMLDWEFETAHLPRSLWVVALAKEPDPGLLVDLTPATMAERFPDAIVLPLAP